MHYTSVLKQMLQVFPASGDATITFLHASLISSESHSQNIDVQLLYWRNELYCLANQRLMTALQVEFEPLIGFRSNSYLYRT